MSRPSPGRPRCPDDRSRLRITPPPRPLLPGLRPTPTIIKYLATGALFLQENPKSRSFVFLGFGPFPGSRPVIPQEFCGSHPRGGFTFSLIQKADLSPREMRAVRDKDLEQGSGAGAGSVTCSDQLYVSGSRLRAAGLGQGQSHSRISRMSGSRLSPRAMRAVRDKDLEQGSGAGAESVTCSDQPYVWLQAESSGAGTGSVTLSDQPYVWL
ncbi:hypothetical protein NDU88_005884 [Pleurodeles waltl]|uniref:Uncharacterized protein n=1 Tax=Pleurodeles waltl TaxID=8319 RepID=A0AAV7L660_PLEWA|nr:hypothetical protein NDU88_005884 [Pleurodeles waltl]